jgi:hypothetical protein
MPRLIIAILISGNAATAQHPRDSWKIKPFDLKAQLNHSLGDAPLTSNEREQILRSINDSGQREAATDFLVGSITLAKNQSDEIVVRGTKEFCGAPGNCSMWLFVRKGGQLRIALATIGQLLIVQNSVSQGFHNIAIGMHGSAFIEQYQDYRWNGSKYEQTDCYLTQYSVHADRSEQPTIVECH